ncbi:cupin domain-containing protein [Yersinia hibernica]|uniref:Cupin 2 conserved barrel domain-containing protein n=1 Tax=Yersinia enterocolitica LC20 TaxID=1443113 RepID=A0A7U4GEV8_YEREN|nr:hypothetical protein [Yersinia hibernica]AHM73477.1 hypothetical protein LC20_02224 [Yersinia hibernica]OVZ84960.1 hypothetical protein CBW54_13835 [Yersinia kristensenii]
MIKFSNFNSHKIKEDLAVGISIIEMFKKEGLQAYGTTIDQGKYVGCHSHAEGEEWYIILSGQGSIWTADDIDGILTYYREDKFNKCSVFCIYPNTAHQLIAQTTVEFIFLCPESHITYDRHMFEDIFS